MFYLIGDIHGYYNKLSALFGKIQKHITGNDIIIFLGDYIDRGPQSFEVIDFLIDLQKNYNTIFLRGNHESMFLNYLQGKDISLFMFNGGQATIDSYIEILGSLRLPEGHKTFYNNLKLYYETDDFIALHAGLRPGISVELQSSYDMIWIREEFYLQQYHWPKLVVFGHTTTVNITGLHMNEIYDDIHKNIIGIDTGAAYGGPLTCLRLPDKIVFQSY
ncbi:MAG: metallophosphoesterase family protein [Spirochaetota bacterium]